MPTKRKTIFGFDMGWLFNNSRKSRKSRKTGRSKTSLAYEDTNSKRVPEGNRKMCVCALQKKSVVCVCGVVKKKDQSRKSRKSRKSSVVYRQIVRDGYTRKDGIYVRSALIEDRGAPGKGPRLIPKLKSGTLRKHGYDSKTSSMKRHVALRSAVAEYGPTTIIRKLNVVATLQKRTNPSLSQQFKTDSAWVKKTFGTTAHPI
jgi:hypothetical protein